MAALNDSAEAVSNTIPGTQDLGQASANSAGSTPVTLNYAFPGLAAAPNFSLIYGRDFKAGTPNCTIAATVTCSLSVTFQPRYPGVRQDAIIVKDQSGNLLGSTLLHGKGLASQAVIYPGLITTYAGTGAWGYSGDAQLANVATFWNPQGIAVDPVGNVYVADSLNQVVRRISIATGIVTTVAGIPLRPPGNAGDGGPATEAKLNNPTAVAIDGAGNLYIADQGNNRIRKVNTISGIISTVAGGGAAIGPDGLGDGGLATSALLRGPTDVAVDASGNLYIADSFSGLIRRVDAVSGIITAVAGGGTATGTDGLGDGSPATQARLNNPTSIAVDASGDLYIADTGHQMIRFVNAASGIITAVAGNGSAGYNGDLGPAVNAELYSPICVRLDAANNIYIADLANNAIRQVQAASGTINTIAGNGASGYSGDGGVSTAANLANPAGLAVDSAGNLYLSDTGNNVLRKIASQTRALAFGSTTIGLASPSQLLTVENIGNSALTFSAISVTGNFRQQSTGYIDCSISSGVLAGSSCTIGIAFVPTTTFSLTGNLAITTNSLNLSTPSPVATLSGTGVLGAAPSIALSVASLAFGNQGVGVSTTPSPITVTNSGTAALGISGISISGSNAADFNVATTCGAVLAVQASCTVTVAFTPGALGARSATLSFIDSVASSPQSVVLTGTGAVAAQARLSSTSLTFAGQTIGSSSSAQTLTLTNNGNIGLSVSGISLSGPNAGDFKLSSTCASILAIGSNCKVSVTFSPTGLGSRTAVLIFADTAPDSPQVVTVSGTGLGTPQIGFMPGILNFGIQKKGSASTQSISITNSGTAALPVAGISVTGTNAPAFVITSNTCGGTIPAQQSCSLTVLFSPLLAGTQSAAISISSSMGAGWNLPLTGTVRTQGNSDFTVWRPSNGTWFVIPGNGGAAVMQQWGLPGDIPVPGDYDGDGQTDFAVWRPSNGTWFVILSSSGAWITHQWGLPGDIPVPGDYDGDGKTDFAVWRPSNGTWFVTLSSSGATTMHQWGLPGDIPVPADFDGDGKTDFAVWRPANGTWFVTLSSSGAGIAQQWGLPGDTPIPGDYDGDGKADFAVWRPSNGIWFIVPSSHPANPLIQQWGLKSDIPITKDFNNDGKSDLAVWRPSNGTWYVLTIDNLSNYPNPTISQQWGLPGDIPR